MSFKGQGVKLEGAKKTGKGIGWPEKLEENLKNVVFWKPSKELSSRRVSCVKGCQWVKEDEERLTFN